MKRFCSVLLLAFALGLLCFPEESRLAVQTALLLCGHLMIPSLFPFFVLSSLLIALGFAESLGRGVGAMMFPFFGLGAPCSAALVLGLIGGYPVGVRITSQLLARGVCRPQEAVRLCCFCNNCGPAFLFSVAGCGVFGASRVGLLFLLTHGMASLLLGMGLHWVLPLPQETHQTIPSIPQEMPQGGIFADAVRDSFFAVLQVCAFVLLFSVVLGLLSAVGLLPSLERWLSGVLPPALAHAFCAGSLELSCGISALTEGVRHPLALPLAAFLLGWGGCSVHAQSLPFLRQAGANVRFYLLCKFLHGLLAGLLTWGFAPLVCRHVALRPLGQMVGLCPLHASLISQEMLVLFLLTGAFILLVKKS